MYYINEKGTSLVRTAWDSSLTEGSAKEQAEEAMELLSSPASDIYKSAVPEGGGSSRKDRKRLCGSVL